MLKEKTCRACNKPIEIMNQEDYADGNSLCACSDYETVDDVYLDPEFQNFTWDSEDMLRWQYQMARAILCN